MKTETTVFAGAVIFLTGLLFISSAFIEEEKNWRTEKIYDGDASFVQLEIVDGKPTAAFSTDSGIVLAEKQVSGFPSFHPLERWLWSPDWKLRNLTDDENSGFYLSMKKRNGELYMAHQYSTLGDRKLGFTHRSNGSWMTEQVDSYQGTGLEPGMYASLTWLEETPVIFYHTAGGDRFVKAEKRNGSWDREVLGTDRGWYTSSGSCGEKVFVMFNSREERSLYTGVLTRGDWSPERIPGNTESSTSVEAQGCVLRAAYHNSDSGEITYYRNGTEKTVAEARLPRLSLDYTDRPRISYYDYGDGLYYASQEDSKWRSQLVDGERSYAGEYNDIETYSDGKPAIVYSTGSGVFYTEYRPQNRIELYRLLKVFAVLLSMAALLAAIYFRYELVELRSKLFKEFKTKVY